MHLKLLESGQLPCYFKINGLIFSHYVCFLCADHAGIGYFSSFFRLLVCTSKPSATLTVTNKVNIIYMQHNFLTYFPRSSVMKNCGQKTLNCWCSGVSLMGASHMGVCSCKLNPMSIACQGHPEGSTEVAATCC